MAAIRKAVLDSHADLGLIFDTDVDRMSAVLKNGKEISRNALIAMMAAILAPDYPGSTIVTDSVTSDELTEFLQGELGLRHLRFGAPGCQAGKFCFQGILAGTAGTAGIGQTCDLRVQCLDLCRQLFALRFHGLCHGPVALQGGLCLGAVLFPGADLFLQGCGALLVAEDKSVSSI